jgi:sulfofructose kinase
MRPAAPPPDRSIDVLGVGAAAVDFVYVLPASPSPAGASGKMRIGSHFVSCGGQVATALAACARMGLRTKFAGATGNDDSGARLRRELERCGVDVSDAVVRDGANQYAVILVVEHTGERMVLWDRDERLRLSEGHLAIRSAAAARVVHVDDVDMDAAIGAAIAARAAGATVTSDIDHIHERTPELVSAVTFPIFAEHVPSMLTGVSDPADALHALRQNHASVLCVTLGARGAMALDGDRLHRAPGFPVTAVDTTGAGDVFRGGFIYGYLQGWPLERVLRFANAAAAVSCTRLGAMASVPSVEETRRLLDSSHSSD